jgi:hypothetical protein
MKWITPCQSTVVHKELQDFPPYKVEKNLQSEMEHLFVKESAV